MPNLRTLLLSLKSAKTIEFLNCFRQSGKCNDESCSTCQIYSFIETMMNYFCYCNEASASSVGHSVLHSFLLSNFVSKKKRSLVYNQLHQLLRYAGTTSTDYCKLIGNVRLELVGSHLVRGHLSWIRYA